MPKAGKLTTQEMAHMIESMGEEIKTITNVCHLLKKVEERRGDKWNR